MSNFETVTVYDKDGGTRVIEDVFGHQVGAAAVQLIVKDGTKIIIPLAEIEELKIDPSQEVKDKIAADLAKSAEAANG